FAFAFAWAVTAMRFLTQHSPATRAAPKPRAQTWPRSPRIHCLLSRSNLFFAFLAQKTLPGSLYTGNGRGGTPPGPASRPKKESGLSHQIEEVATGESDNNAKQSL